MLAGKWGVQERVRQGNVPVPHEHHSWHRGPTSRATATVMHGSPGLRCALAAGGAKAEVLAPLARGYRPVSARLLGRHVAADEPVTLQQTEPSAADRRRSAVPPRWFPGRIPTCAPARYGPTGPRGSPSGQPPIGAGRPRPSCPGRRCGPRGPCGRPWPGRCPGLAGPATVPRATCVRCGPPVVRCGYDSSLTSPGSLTGHGPVLLVIRSPNSSGKIPGIPTAGLQRSVAVWSAGRCTGQRSADPFWVAAAAGVRRHRHRGRTGPG